MTFLLGLGEGHQVPADSGKLTTHLSFGLRTRLGLANRACARSLIVDHMYKGHAGITVGIKETIACEPGERFLFI
jgi:hypothetical protein